jgi:hypothetical protein
MEAGQGPKVKGKKGVGKAVIKKKAASKRRKSWGGSDMSESEDDDVFDDEESDEEFMASKPKGKSKAAAPKQAAKRPREDGPSTNVQWIPPPKGVVQAHVPKKEPVAKKQDIKDTPDKASFKTTKIHKESDSEGEEGMSLFERLNAKVGGGGETKKLFTAPAAAKAKAAPKPKAASKKKKASSDEDSEDSDGDLSPLPFTVALPPFIPPSPPTCCTQDMHVENNVSSKERLFAPCLVRGVRVRERYTHMSMHFRTADVRVAI